MPKSSSTRQSRTRQNSRMRRDDQKQELRQLILAAAGDEFLAHGYENFSLRRVAERVGYTPTTIYLYFQNKDDLLLATVQDGFFAFDRAITAAAQATDPLERIENLGLAYLEFGLKNPALYRLMFMQRSDFYLMPHLVGARNLEKSADVPEQRVVAQELLVAAVEEGIAVGILRPADPLLLADTLWSATHGLVALAVGPLMPPDHARNVASELFPTLIAGLKR